jgi:hypothetical protein
LNWNRSCDLVQEINVFTFSMGVPSCLKWALTCKCLVIGVTIEWPFAWDVKVSQLLVTSLNEYFQVIKSDSLSLQYLQLAQRKCVFKK